MTEHVGKAEMPGVPKYVGLTAAMTVVNAKASSDLRVSATETKAIRTLRAFLRSCQKILLF